MPEIYNALHVERALGGETAILTLEVAQHIGDNLVRAISMQPTDGLDPRRAVKDTGSAISVPVGDATKGHVFNALGQPLDVASVDADTYWPIHRPSPAFDQLESKTEIFPTGIKVIDLLAPVRRRRQDRPVRRCRRRQDGPHPGDDLPRRQGVLRRVGVRRRRRAHPRGQRPVR
jgi:F-type H+-transporting ATPase subunit beta